MLAKQDKLQSGFFINLSLFLPLIILLMLSYVYKVSLFSKDFFVFGYSITGLLLISVLEKKYINKGINILSILSVVSLLSVIPSSNMWMVSVTVFSVQVVFTMGFSGSGMFWLSRRDPLLISSFYYLISPLFVTNSFEFWILTLFYFLILGFPIYKKSIKNSLDVSLRNSKSYNGFIFLLLPLVFILKTAPEVPNNLLVPIVILGLVFAALKEFLFFLLFASFLIDFIPELKFLLVSLIPFMCISLRSRFVANLFLTSILIYFAMIKMSVEYKYLIVIIFPLLLIPNLVIDYGKKSNFFLESILFMFMLVVPVFIVFREILPLFGYVNWLSQHNIIVISSWILLSTTIFLTRFKIYNFIKKKRKARLVELPKILKWTDINYLNLKIDFDREFKSKEIIELEDSKILNWIGLLLAISIGFILWI